MRTDNRLSRMLHVLLHMSFHDGRATSENIARMLDTNPVVVRRMMAGLREHGYVQSEKGHGGGWLLIRELAEITVRDVYLALGKPPVFAIGPSIDHPDCSFEQTVNAAIADTLRDAELSLLTRFGEITLADLAAQSRCRHHADEQAS